MAIAFETHPDRYRHWKLSIEGETAALTMDVELHGGLRPEYELKLNSYDLGVDIELADAVQRLRFEHPEVKVVVLRSGKDRVFCSGANIPMLGTSSHAFKVNFCKFTNETRLYIEDASRYSGQKYLAAVRGPCAGGGYELALACDDIVLVDDGSSAVSLPETPLLAVLPGTGGLTRVVDKRKVRRDLADLFCTTEEGVRGKKALDWNLVDAIAPRTKFDDVVRERVARLAQVSAGLKKGHGIQLEPLAPTVEGDTIKYRYVTLEVSPAARTASLTLMGPMASEPRTPDEIERAGSNQWALRCFRELDDALLRLRFEYPHAGLILVHTVGDRAAVVEIDHALHEHRSHWLANEILRLQARVLRRLDLMSRSMFALIDAKSCFAGALLELALSADRTYMLADDDEKVAIRLSPLNFGSFPMVHGLSRIEARFWGLPERPKELATKTADISTGEALTLGLVTAAPDDIDWDDDVRIAIEERASMSPDALTGMEASLRFPGPETLESKIFARLSAWQNWIFQRPNSVGPNGALTKYGKPERPSFDWTRC